MSNLTNEQKEKLYYISKEATKLAVCGGIGTIVGDIVAAAWYAVPGKKTLYGLAARIVGIAGVAMVADPYINKAVDETFEEVRNFVENNKAKAVEGKTLKDSSGHKRPIGFAVNEEVM